MGAALLDHARRAVARALDYLDAGEPDAALASLMMDAVSYHGPGNMYQIDIPSIAACLPLGPEETRACAARLGLAEGSGRYAVITPDGQLRHVARPPLTEFIDEETGPGRVCRPLAFGMAGWSGLGAVFDPNGSRNPVGACVMATLNAPGEIHAGPVVITGWEDDRPSGCATRPLTERLAAELAVIHGDVTDALAGRSRLEENYRGVRWAASMREYAAFVRDTHVGPGGG